MAMEKMDNFGVPEAQIMEKGTFLDSQEGVVIRQFVQADEIVAQALTGLPCERANKYKISALPQGRRPRFSQNDREGWKPTNMDLETLPMSLYALEQSSCCERFWLGCAGCMNLRNFTMPLFIAGTNQAEAVFKRPLNLGGQLCCPHEIYVNMPVGTEFQMVGKVQQDMHCGKNYILRCCQAAYCCKDYYDIMLVDENTRNQAQPLFHKQYQLEVNLCCCGAHNNFCGSTIFKADSIFAVHPYENGRVNTARNTGILQKTFGDCSLGSMGRGCFSFSNYLVQFPEASSAAIKALFIAAAIQTEYVHFERSGDEN